METRGRTYLFVLPWSLSYLGGVNQVVINLAREIRASSMFCPIVLICDWNAPNPVFGESDGITTVRWRIRPWHPEMGIKETIGYWLWEKSFRDKFEQFCITHRVGVINVHYPEASSLAFQRLTTNLRVRPRLVFSFHGTDVQRLERSARPTVLAWAKLFDEPNVVVACSQNLRGRICKVFGGKVMPTVIHNGVNIGMLANRITTSEPKSRRSILNVGRFDDVKAQDVLVDAFAHIFRDYPDIDLVMVGPSGGALPRLKSQCAREALSSRVHFHEAIPHHRVSDFYGSATVFAFPSRSEGCPLAILEAGAFGLPVIASRVGGIPEILAENDTGLLVTPDQPAELARCLRWTLDNPEHAKRMGERLRDRIQTHFTWTMVCSKYLEIVTEER